MQMSQEACCEAEVKQLKAGVRSFTSELSEPFKCIACLDTETRDLQDKESP